jgi:S1-C subfamily serine protease
MSHYFAQQLARNLNARPEARASLKLRTILKGFGYHRRTDRVVTEVLNQLRACGISADLSLDQPASLDDRVALMLTHDTSPPQTNDHNAAPIDLSEVAERVIRATVMITTDTGVGSGFIVTRDGLLVTARHVIANEDGESDREVGIVLATGQRHRAVVFRSHRKLDFALLWMKQGGPFATVDIGNPKQLRPAETLLAIGCPSALRNTVTRGIVCNPCQRRAFVDYIQTDTSIDHGNSGGPLVDQAGRVIGVTQWGMQIDAGKFALPIDYLTGEIAAAVSRGRNATIAANYCRTCGYCDPNTCTWFCRNCGKQSISASHDMGN